MGAKEDAELVRSGYEAFAKGDMDTVSKVFAPDIRWHVGGRNRLSGSYDGQEAVFGFFGDLNEVTGGTFNIEIHDLLASDDHVVVLAHETAHKDDRTLDSNEIHVWHVAEGKATEFWGIPQNPYETDSFFG